MSTGSPSQDAQHDFSRARRARLLSDIARRLRGEPDDVGLILPFEEVVEALGRSRAGRSRPAGRAARRHRRHRRPGRATSIAAFARIAAPALALGADRGRPAPRRGDAARLVVQGRRALFRHATATTACSVAKSQGREDIDAYVTEVTTRVRLSHDLRVSELPLKGHERLFRERVPLNAQQRARIELSEPWDFGWLAEMVEAWGFRFMQQRGHFADRYEVAQRWFEDEYVPVSEMLEEGGLTERGRVAGRRLHASRGPAVHDPAHPRVVRRRHRPPPRQRSSAREAAPPVAAAASPPLAALIARRNRAGVREPLCEPSSPSRSAPPRAPPPRTSSIPRAGASAATRPSRRPRAPRRRCPVQAHSAAGTVKDAAASVAPSRTEPMDDATLADRVRRRDLPGRRRAEGRRLDRRPGRHRLPARRGARPGVDRPLRRGDRKRAGHRRRREPAAPAGNAGARGRAARTRFGAVPLVGRSVARARVSVPGPRGEHDQQPGVGARPDRVTLLGSKTAANRARPLRPSSSTSPSMTTT